MDALLALLVSQTAGLTHLVLQRVWAKRPLFLCLVLFSSSQRHYSLPVYDRLEELSHEWHAYDRAYAYGKCTEAVLGIFYLRGMRRLTASLDLPFDLHWPSASAAGPICTNLTFLSLTDVREGQLDIVLRACPNLQGFEWRLDYDCLRRHRGNTNLLNLDTLFNALCLVRSTLRHLLIAMMAQDSDNESQEMQATGSVKRLSSFASLRTIRVPCLFLIDFLHDNHCEPTQIFPRSTQRLILGDDLSTTQMDTWEIDEDRALDFLQQMLITRKEDFPHLEEIVFGMLADEWFKRSLDRIRELSLEHNFKLSIDGRFSVLRVAYSWFER